MPFTRHWANKPGNDWNNGTSLNCCLCSISEVFAGCSHGRERGGRTSVMKLLTVRSYWRLSLPDDSQALRRGMEVIRWPRSQCRRDESLLSASTLCRRSHLYFWPSPPLTEAAALHSRLRRDVGGAFESVGAGRRRESSRVFVSQLFVPLIDINLIVTVCFPGMWCWCLSIMKLMLKVGFNFLPYFWQSSAGAVYLGIKVCKSWFTPTDPIFIHISVPCVIKERDVLMQNHW